MRKEETVTEFDMLEEMDLVDLSAPRNMGYVPMKDTDVLIGVMSEELQRLDCLRFDLNSKAKRLNEGILNLMADHNVLHKHGDVETSVCEAHADELTKLIKEYAFLKQNLSMANNVFRSVFRLRFPQTMTSLFVSVREGYQVVFRQEDTLSEIEEMMKKHGVDIRIIRF